MRIYRSEQTLRKAGPTRLDGKVEIIPGRSRGMGSEEARLFTREGATVVLGDVLEDEDRKLQAELKNAGVEALFPRLDVTIEEEWKKAIDSTVSRYGRLDVLVNNAGISGSFHSDITSTEAGTISWKST